MDNASIIEKLRAITPLKFLKQEDIRGLLKSSRMIRYEPGEVIFKEGEYGDWIYFLITGRIGIRKQGELISELKRRGDLFGEMGALGGTGRTASVFADEDSACLTVDADQFGQLTGKDKMAFGFLLYRLLAEVLSDRLKQTTERLTRAGDEILRLKAKIRELKPAGE